MHLQAAFGDKLKLVGSHEATGSWDLDDAPDMTWHGRFLTLFPASSHVSVISILTMST